MGGDRRQSFNLYSSHLALDLLGTARRGGEESSSSTAGVTAVAKTPEFISFIHCSKFYVL